MKKIKNMNLMKTRDIEFYLAETTEPELQRIFGGDRYETAVNLSQSLTNGSEKVFVASGISMIDALNVGPYSIQDPEPY